jgi:carbon-monoxide dehydrogenase large subunit
MIGASRARPEARRLSSGQGCYIDDIVLPRMLHAAFLRSPFAHARIRSMDVGAARSQPGVAAILTGAELARICAPWRTALANFPDHHSPLQHALAIDEVAWQGEGVAVAVAESRAEAEDALEHVTVDWQELPVVADALKALAADAPQTHAALNSNLAIERKRESGDTAAALGRAAFIASHRFTFGRQTGVSLEPRGIIAHFDVGSGDLLVHQSHQAPFQMREIIGKQLGLNPAKVRVICPDVGGAFGLKLHAYPDELAAVAMALHTGRPVKFIADRIESFVTDAQARDATAEARLAVDAEGRILALEADIVFGFGAYSCYPRGSIGEALQAIDLCGAPYIVPAFRGRVRGAYLNKPPTGAYRAVGQPIAATITEQLLDQAAAGLGLDPVEIRRRNLLPDGATAERRLAPSGIPLGPLSLNACLDTLVTQMDYAAKRRRHADAPEPEIARGIGLACFVELTGVGSGLYGANKVRVSAQEGARLSLEAGGIVVCESSVTDQGQGTRSALAQIIGEILAVDPDSVVIRGTDTASNPPGGGSWASRGMALGGEASWRAATALRAQILGVAGAMLQTPSDQLCMSSGSVVNAQGMPQISLGELADAVHFFPDSIPLTEIPPLMAQENYVPRDTPYFISNGVQAAEVEVNLRSGAVRVLGFWVTEDCGRIVNPLLVDSQLRGGVVQGIGAALFENCIYSPGGQLTNGSLAEYLVPMAVEMPDIAIAHVSMPERSTLLGAKGVGEAGTVAGAAAIWAGVNDALRRFGVAVSQQPFTPEHILDQLVGPEESISR